IKIGDEVAAQRQIYIQVLNDDGTPCDDLVVGDLWVLRPGDSSYAAAQGTLTEIQLNSNDVGTYRYQFHADEIAKLGQCLLTVSKAGVLYQPTEYYVSSYHGFLNEITVGRPDYVQNENNTISVVSLGANASNNLSEYENQRIIFIDGKNKGYSRVIVSAADNSGVIDVTLDADLPEACDATTFYAVISNAVRGLTDEELTTLLNPVVEGSAPVDGVGFIMRTLDGALATGKTVSLKYRKNLGAYTALTNASATELGEGEYKAIFTDAEFSGARQIRLKATADGCQPTIKDIFLPPSGL